MTTREEALEIALALPGAYADTPFHDDNWVVARRLNKRIFLATFERQGKIWLNVKVRPGWSDVLTAHFESVVPAYHMNKRHWNQVYLDRDVPEALIRSLIDHSYEQVYKKIPRKVKAEHEIG